MGLLYIYPLRIVLCVLRELHRLGQGYITIEELVRIIIPLPGCVNAVIFDYVNFIIWFRQKQVILDGWPNCVTGVNDVRIAREYLLFLSHYGYVERNVTMPEVLEAAHIKPYKYRGEDTVANGFAMRMDIHLLFDAGHLRISEEGEVFLSTRARLDYGATVPRRIVIPDYTNRDFLRWRWNNYNGL